MFRRAPSPKSAYVGKPVRSDTAMTGEISLTGLVLPVGGIKEKVLAAHRAGIRRIILPKANEKDLKEVPQEVRDELTVIPVERIEEVLPAAFNQDAAPSSRGSGRPHIRLSCPSVISYVRIKVLFGPHARQAKT